MSQEMFLYSPCFFFFEMKFSAIKKSDFQSNVALTSDLQLSISEEQLAKLINESVAKALAP